LHQACKDAIDLALSACTQDIKLDTESAGRRQQVLGIGFGIRIGRIHQRRDQAGVGQEVAQEPQAFRPQFVAQTGHARHVSARSIETGDEAILDWVAADDEHDRDRCGRRLSHPYSFRAVQAGNDRDLTAHEVGCERRQPIIL
jgi:hypothetical protein